MTIADTDETRSHRVAAVDGCIVIEGLISGPVTLSEKDAQSLTVQLQVALISAMMHGTD